MNEVLIGLARFVFRLDRGGEIGPADKEGYLDRGIRRLELPASDKVIGPYDRDTSAQLPWRSSDAGEWSVDVRCSRHADRRGGQLGQTDVDLQGVLGENR